MNLLFLYFISNKWVLSYSRLEYLTVPTNFIRKIFRLKTEYLFQRFQDRKIFDRKIKTAKSKHANLSLFIQHIISDTWTLNVCDTVHSNQNNKHMTWCADIYHYKPLVADNQSEESYTTLDQSDGLDHVTWCQQADYKLYRTNSTAQSSSANFNKLSFHQNSSVQETNISSHLLLLHWNY